MWSKLPSRFVARMLSGHLAVGLAASVLLYVLCFSGTLMVFHEEFARWEQPGVPEMDAAEPAAVGRAAEAMLARVDEPPHHFYLSLPVPDMPRMTVIAEDTAMFADADGNLVAPVDHGWRDFLEKLHYYLTLPGVLGLTVVGILGVLMAALVVSGLLALPRLFRDAFRLRLTGSRRLREADLHNRLGAWTSPFLFALAISGAALGLASLSAAIMAPKVSGGDTEAFFAPVFGSEAEGSEAPAPLADIPAALANFSAEHPDLVPWWVTFHDPATEGQTAEILAQHPRRLVYGDNYAFDAEGRLTGNTGLSDGPVGQQLVAAIYPLHFGSFGHLPIKLIYGLLGLVSCVVVASGLNIWLVKRRQNGRPAPVMERAWQATVWGTPAAMALVLAVETLTGAPMAVLVTLFWVALALLLVASGIRTDLDRRAPLQLTTAVLVATALVAHHAANGVVVDATPGLGVSLALFAAAIALAVPALRSRRADATAAASSPLPQK